MNRDEKCGNRSNFDQEAVLKFYISNSEQDYGQNDTDNKQTEEAYKILDSYWKGDTIVLLDRLFADKVSEAFHVMALRFGRLLGILRYSVTVTVTFRSQLIATTYLVFDLKATTSVMILK